MQAPRRAPLTFFEFNPVRRSDDHSGPAPAFLAPLSMAARDKRPLEPPMLEIVGAIGFTGVHYGFTTARTLDRDSRGYHWTTLPRQWLTEYDQYNLVEVDPRLAGRWNNPTPIIWDRRIVQLRPEIAVFLEHAVSYGSGLAVFFRDEHFSKTMFTVHAPSQELDEAIVQAWVAAIPALLMLAFEFHAIFRRHFIAAGIPPLHQGAPLSPREVQCLQLAAHGLTSADIGSRLSLSHRTVDFHFCNIISKLAAANRHEAIALGISQGLITA
jgi:DNA-binding CsgD family transcriptional regulator